MAQFRIDQVTPGAGTAGRTRHDLVPGEVITLVATDPIGGGVTYEWEILDRVGSSATLSATTGSSVTIGPFGLITQPCAFLIRLTANDSGTVTTVERIASVRTTVAGLRLALFPETAPSSGTLTTNDPDESTDNAVYVNRSGTGANEQNWRGWGEWAYEVVMALEAISGAVAAPSLQTVYDAAAPTVIVDASGPITVDDGVSTPASLIDLTRVNAGGPALIARSQGGGVEPTVQLEVSGDGFTAISTAGPGATLELSPTEVEGSDTLLVAAAGELRMRSAGASVVLDALDPGGYIETYVDSGLRAWVGAADAGFAVDVLPATPNTHKLGDAGSTWVEIHGDQFLDPVQRSLFAPTLEAYGGVAFVVATTDHNKMIACSNGAAITATVNFGIGEPENNTTMWFQQQGAGQITIVAVGGTVRVPTGYLAATAAQWSIIKITIDAVNDEVHVSGSGLALDPAAPVVDLQYAYDGGETITLATSTPIQITTDAAGDDAFIIDDGEKTTTVRAGMILGADTEAVFEKTFTLVGASPPTGSAVTTVLAGGYAAQDGLGGGGWVRVTPGQGYVMGGGEAPFSQDTPPGSVEIIAPNGGGTILAATTAAGDCNVIISAGADNYPDSAPTVSESILMRAESTLIEDTDGDVLVMFQSGQSIFRAGVTAAPGLALSALDTGLVGASQSISFVTDGQEAFNVYRPAGGDAFEGLYSSVPLLPATDDAESLGRVDQRWGETYTVDLRSWWTPRVPWVRETGNFNLSVTAKVILISSASTVTVTLPDPADHEGRCWDILLEDDAPGDVTLARFGSEDIQGVAADYVLSGAWSKWRLFCNGDDWFLI
jgi:hypothetical protein